MLKIEMRRDHEKNFLSSYESKDDKSKFHVLSQNWMQKIQAVMGYLEYKVMFCNQLFNISQQ